MRSSDDRSRCCCRLVRCWERISSVGRHRPPLFRSYFGIAFVLDAEQPVQDLCQAGARRRECVVIGPACSSVLFLSHRNPVVIILWRHPRRSRPLSPVWSSSPSDPPRRVFTDCHLPLRIVLTRHQGLLARPIVASLFAGEVVAFNSLPHGLKTRPPSETASFFGRSCRPICAASGGASIPSPLAPQHVQRRRPRPPAEEQTDDTPAEENAGASDADETTYDTPAERHLGADLDDDDDDVQLPSPSPTGLRGDPRDPGHWTGAFEAFAASPIDDQVLTGDADGDGGPSANGALTDVQLHERRLDDLFDKLSMAPYYVVRRTSTKVRHAELVGRTTHDPFTSLPRLFFCDSLTSPIHFPY